MLVATISPKADGLYKRCWWNAALTGGSSRSHPARARWADEGGCDLCDGPGSGKSATRWALLQGPTMAQSPHQEITGLRPSLINKSFFSQSTQTQRRLRRAVGWDAKRPIRSKQRHRVARQGERCSKEEPSGKQSFQWDSFFATIIAQRK